MSAAQRQGLDFGYFFTMDNPGNRLPYNELLRNAIEQAVLAEDVGFGCVWMGEHHFGHEGFDIHPNPIITGSFIAARTSTIRIGLAAAIINQWHPLRLAEDVALLDQLSGGRVECGLGRGISVRELTNLHPDGDRRNGARNWALFRESVEIVRRAWTEDPFQFDGLFYRFPTRGVPDHTASWYPRDERYRSETGEYVGMSIVPKPRQQPHPPMWNVLDSTPGFAACAELDLKPITWLRSTGGINEAFGVYRDAYAKHHGRVLAPGEDCALLRTCFVAPDDETARQIAEEPVETIYGRYGPAFRSSVLFLDPGEEQLERAPDDPWYDFLFERDHLLIGSPESVAETIVRLKRATGIDQLLLMMWLPGIEQPDIMRSIELFGEQVVPRVHEALGTETGRDGGRPLARQLEG